MSDSIERIQAAEDQRHFRVANYAQAGEQAQEFVEGLSKTVGKIYVIDEYELAKATPIDREGLEELRALAAL